LGGLGNFSDSRRGKNDFKSYGKKTNRTSLGEGKKSFLSQKKKRRNVRLLYQVSTEVEEKGGRREGDLLGEKGTNPSPRKL